MRVTERSIFESARRNTANAAEREARASERASTGLAVQHSWDSAETGRVVRERVTADRARAISDQAGRRFDELDTADQALGTVNNAITGAAVLAVQMANDVVGAQARSDAAIEVRARLDAILSAMNVDIAGRYVFSGTADTTRPFDAAGAYQGDAGVLQVETAPGITQVASLRGDVALNGAGGGIDIPAAFEAFATALEANDLVGIRQAIDDMNAGIEQISTARSEVGGMQKSLEFAISTGREIADNADTRATQIVEVDFVEAALELAQANRALEAALTVAAKSFDNTLLNRL